ncbi:MAG: TIGR02206 family membrane protein [Flavobacteriaceae bacterium]|nr:TIGR02206 family membrane protein [Flavobacteriaceae bacterium]
MLLQYFLKNRVEIGSLQQLTPILIAVIFSFFLFRYSKKNLNRKEQEGVLHSLAIFISLTVISFHIYKISQGGYSLQTDLPLYLCSLLGLIIPVFSFYKRNWMYEILLFWIIAGTTQAIITPDIHNGFPSFEFFRYWVVHLGLVVVILYATIVLNFKPTIKSVLKSFLALQVYVVFMVVVNFVLDANYFYLNKKPESASLLDYFGEWPLYIVVAQLILVPFFIVIYFGFNLIQKRLN